MTSVTVVVPMTIRRRGGRKQLIGPDGASLRDGQDSAGATTTRGDPALVKALARAFRWRRMLEEGRYSSIRELAKAESANRAYVGRLLNLTLFAPDIVEAILNGRQRTERGLQRLEIAIPEGWDEQRRTIFPDGDLSRSRTQYS